MIVMIGIIALLVVPIAFAAFRVATRRDATPARRIPLSAPIRIEVEPPAPPDPFDDQIEAYLRGAMKATGTRLPTAPARAARGSTPPAPLRAAPPTSEFDDEPPTLVTVRPYSSKVH